MPLKLAAEASYVETTELSVNNIVEVAAYADAKNLALLREAVIDFIVESENDDAEAVSFDDLPNSMMKDLFFATRRSKKPRLSDSCDELSKMKITELRRMALDKGLDVDGSRESLISNLRKSC